MRGGRLVLGRHEEATALSVRTNDQDTDSQNDTKRHSLALQ